MNLTPRYDRDGIRLFAGDALAILPEIEAGSVDAVVTDPPAGISFMNKSWDDPDTFPVRGKGERKPPGVRLTGSGNPTDSVGFAGGIEVKTSKRHREAFIAFLTPVLAECLRIAKPGARLLCWAIPRTSHWTGTAIEDAGWVVEDRISHLFGSGFPKHKSKLKPACEDWWLAWKPDRKATALNIDACRIESGSDYHELAVTQGGREGGGFDVGSSDGTRNTMFRPAAGRWPANLVLSHHPDCQCVGTKRVKGSSGGLTSGSNAFGQDSGWNKHNNRPTEIGRPTDPDGLETVSAWNCHPNCPVRLLDEQSGERKADWARGSKNPGCFQQGVTETYPSVCYGDFGGASRFFYCAKAPSSERFFYCRDCADAYPPEARDAHLHGHAMPDGKPDWRHVASHPTQKSEDLMRWLCRLIAKPGDTILDAFAGSGSTLKAAALEGMRAIGSEREAEYVDIASRRLREAETPLFSALTG